MTNKRFEYIMEQHMEKFVNDFNIWSREIYKLNNTSRNEKLLHPGEFGTYREDICKDFLSLFIPQNMAIGCGFIIDRSDYTSTQSDIVVFDRDNTPLVRDIDKQRFFPIENVIAVGEIKSKLTKSIFKKALKRLSVIKEKRAQINDPYITRGSQIYENFDIVMADKAIYAPYDKHQDQIVTFIICEKLSFDITKFDFMDIYENMHPSFRINMILSLEDGVLAYKHSDGTIHPYPVCKNEIAIPYFCKATTEDKWSHIKLFANNFFTATKCCTILNSDIVYYMQFNADQMKQIPLTSKQEGAQND